MPPFFNLDDLEGIVNHNLLEYVRNFATTPGALPKLLKSYRYVDLGESFAKNLFILTNMDYIYYFTYCYQDGEYSYEWQLFNPLEVQALQDLLMVNKI